PAVRVGRVHDWWPAERPPRNTRWLIAYALASIVVSLVPVAALAAGGAVVAAFVRGAASWGAVVAGAAAGLVPGTLVAGVV
ncbi:hypothetical protein SB719_22275, partial [Pantoea sp. SIMBA_079]|uniref:hypothetical protein n=1 Tax=Pantoea sp. SIMBA_079 TaxID=3085817 RepID=UPI0039955FA3